MEGRDFHVCAVVSEDSPILDKPSTAILQQSPRNRKGLRLYFVVVRFAMHGSTAVIKKVGRTRLQTLYYFLSG